MDARLELDLSQSRIKIPEHFYQVRYDSACYPGAPEGRGLERGANCQQICLPTCACEGDGCLPNLPFFWSRVAPRSRAEVLWTERTNFGEVFSRRSPDSVRDVRRREQQNDVF
jgi:hypothetical protein